MKGIGKAPSPPDGAARANGTRARGTLGWLAIALCALCVGLIASPAASAAPPTLIGTFDGSATPDGSIGNDNSTRVAVDEATGDVYVLDIIHDVVDKFDQNGTYLSQIRGSSTTAGTFGFSLNNGIDDLAVDNTGGTGQGNLYVLSRGTNTIFAFNASGTELWEASGISGRPCGIGVDPGGNLWVGNRDNTFVEQRRPADGSPTVTTIPVGGNDWCHLAVDNDGAIYMTGFDFGLEKIDLQGNITAFDSSPSAGYWAVSTSFLRNDIFTVSTDSGIPNIRQWDKNGNQISRVDLPFTDSLRGVAIDGVRGRLYVTDIANQNVQMYRVLPQPPTVTPGSPTNVTSTGGTVNGRVNPNGSDVTDCHVDYEADAQFVRDGNAFVTFASVPCAQALPLTGTRDSVVSADLTGLTPDTTYHTRIVATNAGDTTNGNDTLLVTPVPPPSPPSVVTGSASGISTTGATLNGTVNPNGNDVTDCHFEYGTDTSYGRSAPCSALPGSGSSPVTVSAVLTGLTPGTPYHFRLAGANVGGTGTGSDATFRTSDTCATNQSLCTCTDGPQFCPQKCPGTPSLCAAHIHVTGWSWVKSNGFLKVKCTGDTGGTCATTLTLKATIKVKVKKGHKTVVKKKTITVGTATDNLAVGGTASLKVKLTSAGKSALKTGALTVTVNDSKDGKIGSVRIKKMPARRAKHKRK